MAIQQSAAQKAALLMVAMGPDLAASIMKNLEDNVVEAITLEVANMRKVSVAEKDVVLEECYQMSLAEDALIQGGLDYAKELLTKALGLHKSVEILSRLQGTLQTVPFEFMRRADPIQVLNFLQNEHPQTIALVLAHLSPEQSTSILSNLSTTMQLEVVERIAKMDRAEPEVIMDVERVLERKIANVFTQRYAVAGGVRAVAEIMNRLDRTTEKTIMENITERDENLGDDIKRLMFVFDDIVLLDDRGIQNVLRQVDQKDVVLALKGANDQTKSKLMKNMSGRQRQMVIEEIEVLGPTRVKVTEESQQKIINIIRQLEERGEISVSRGGASEQFV